MKAMQIHNRREDERERGVSAVSSRLSQELLWKYKAELIISI